MGAEASQADADREWVFDLVSRWFRAVIWDPAQLREVEDFNMCGWGKVWSEYPGHRGKSRQGVYESGLPERLLLSVGCHEDGRIRQRKLGQR